MEAKIFLAILGMMAIAEADYAPTGPYPQSGYPAANYATEPSTPEQGGPTSAGGFGGPGFVGGPFFPPIVPPPHFALTPICAAIDALKFKFLSIAHPVLTLGLGAFLFVMLKSLLLPKFGGHLGHLFNKKVDHDDLVDRVSSDVARAISEGVCTEKIACSLGMSARRIPGAKALARVMGSDKDKEEKSFFNIIRTVAAGKQNDCSEYLCLTKENTNDVNK